MRYFLFLLVFVTSLIFSSEIEIDVPLYLNQRLIENIIVIADTDSGVIKLDELALKYPLKEYFTLEGFNNFVKFISTIDFLEENSIKEENDFKIFFSSTNQSLYLDINLKLLRTKYTDVRKPIFSGKSEIGKKIEPDPLSGYINIEMGLKDRRNFNISFNPKGVSTFGNADLNLHYKDTLFVGNGYFLAANTLGVNPVNAVIIKRFPDSGLKWSIGSINANGISFQGTSPLLGVNFSKNSDLITDPTIGSMSRHDIFLNADSDVKVKVNGIEVNRLNLPAGSHSLQNFPLSQGLNNVCLEIMGPTGETREIDLSMFYNSSLMKVGETEANISFGVPSYTISKGAGGFYDIIPSFAFTGYLKGGLLESLTLGGYFQVFQNQFFSGLQGVFVKPYFKTIVEGGFSWKSTSIPYFKTRVAINQPDGWKFPISWNFVLEAAEKDFRYFGGADLKENLSYQASGSIGTSTKSAVSLNMVGQYGNFRDFGDKYSLQGTLAITPKNWLSIRCMLSWNKVLDQPGKLETAFTFDLTPRYKDFGTKTSYNSYQKALTTAATFNKGLVGRRSINGSVGFNNAPGANQLEGNIYYNGAYTTVRASQHLMKNSAFLVDSTVAVTDASIGTAFVFSGKTFAISRPIRDSFVIVSPNKFLRKTPVLVNPGRLDYSAKASYFMPAVVPISSYSNMLLSLAQENGGYGGSYEDTLYNVVSLNKSGSVIEIGSAPSYIVEGTLLEGNKILEGITGMLISIDKVDGEIKKYKFFTDSDGAFQILDVKEGKYRIRFTNKNYETIENIEVKAQDELLNYIYLGEFCIKVKSLEKIYKELKYEN